MPPAVYIEISAAVGEELVHRLTAVVASDVCVEVLPDALNAVGVGAIGRQEVEHDATAERSERSLRAARRMDL